MVLNSLITLFALMSVNYRTGGTCLVNGLVVPCAEAGAQAAAVFAAVMIPIFVILIGVYVVFSILQMKLFKKFGVAGWKAWVPFVNTWTFLELGGQHGWWQFVPVANFIFPIIAAYNIGLKFNKDGAFVVLYIFLSLIWFIIMALKSTTLSDKPSSSEINLGGLGVTADQTILAKPEPAVSSDSADATSTKEAPSENKTDESA